jgi:hypothetical protein
VPGLLSGEVRAWWEHLGWAFANAGAGTVRFGDGDLPVRGAEGRRSYEWLSDRLRELDRSERDRATQELVERLRPSGQARDRELFMDWQAAKELVERGFEVGSHSNYHAVLSRERAAELAGHTHAFTTDAGWNTRARPRMEEHRIVLEPHRGFTSQGVRRVVARISRTALPAESPSSL